METINVHNCKGICVQKHCDKDQTHFDLLEIEGFIMALGLCEEHMQEYTEAVENSAGEKQWKQQK